MNFDFMACPDRLANGLPDPGKFVRRDGAWDFENDGKLLLLSRFDRKGRPDRSRKRRVAMLQRNLDILGMMVAAANDDEILESAGHEELATGQESEIAGTDQPISRCTTWVRAEHHPRLFRTAPVAISHAASANPDFADMPLRQRRLSVGVDDEHIDLRRPAADHGKRASVDFGSCRHRPIAFHRRSG